MSLFRVVVKYFPPHALEHFNNFLVSLLIDQKSQIAAEYIASHFSSDKPIVKVGILLKQCS